MILKTLIREDSRMQSDTSHELIHGPIASGKTETVRQRLAEEIVAEHVQTWIVDPHMAVPEYSKAADRYAWSRFGIDELLVSLVDEAYTRAERLTNLGLTEFTPGDPRHGLPLIAVTIEAAEDVLIDRRRRSLVERAMQVSRKRGIKFRLVVPKPHVGWFGGSEVIRSMATSGRIFECERATA